MYQGILKCRQGSASKRFERLENVYELHKRVFENDILGKVKQNYCVKYMQDALEFDARYLGVVVWR